MSDSEETLTTYTSDGDNDRDNPSARYSEEVLEQDSRVTTRLQKKQMLASGNGSSQAVGDNTLTHDRMTHMSQPTQHEHIQLNTDRQPAQDSIVAILAMMQEQMAVTQQQLAKADERWHAVEEDRRAERYERKQWEQEERDRADKVETLTKRQWEEDKDLRRELFDKEQQKRQERDVANLAKAEDLRQSKAAKSISKMGVSESILSYFERIEASFCNEHIVSDRYKLEALRQGLHGKPLEALLSVTKGAEISYDVAKNQVLTATGYNWYNCLSHFASIAPTSNEPTTWWKDLSFRIYTILRRSPALVEMDSEVINTISEAFSAQLLAAGLPHEGIDRVLTKTNVTHNDIFNSFVAYAGEHPHVFKRTLRYHHKSYSPHDRNNSRRDSYNKPYDRNNFKSDDKSDDHSTPNSSVPSNSEKTFIPTCYVCNKKGHKAPECPDKQKKGDKDKSGSNNKQSNNPNIRRISPCKSETKNSEWLIQGKLNGVNVPVRLDTGADLTLVHRSLISDDMLLGNQISISFANKETAQIDTTNVTIQAGDFKKTLTVGVSSTINSGEILLGNDFGRYELSHLIIDSCPKPSLVGVITRAQARTQRQEDEVANETQARESADATPPEVVLRSGSEGGTASESPSQAPAASSDPQDSSEEETCPSVTSPQECPLTDDMVELPVASIGGVNRVALCKLQSDCNSLAKCREWGSSKELGYFYSDGLLMFNPECSSESDEILNHAVIVLPKSLVPEILKIGHDHSGHFGKHKTQSIIAKNFTWPGIARDVSEYVKSCQSCQLNSKQNPSKAPLTVTDTLTVPFEKLAFDLVGPFTKSKKGSFQYLLTCVCVSSHYCWAIPLKTITSEDVANGMIAIFKDSGIPREILSDRGTQFLSHVVRQLCSFLHIHHLKTAPYRPQSNGVLERLHGTLVATIKKSCTHKLDWASHVDLSVFSLRNMPHRDYGLTPFELVNGRKMPHIVTYIKELWEHDATEGLNVTEYMHDLAEKLEVIRSCMREKLQDAKVKQRNKEDSKNLRTFSVGEKVLFRTPGLVNKLESAWQGPYSVSKKIGDLNYEVQWTNNGKKHKRVVHVNHLKPFNQELLSVNRVVVVADDQPQVDQSSSVSEPDLTPTQGQELDVVLSQYESLFSDKPGLTDLAEFHIKTSTEQPISLKPYTVPLGLEAQFKEELDNLLDSNIIEPSDSAWAFPTIPVKKKDGGLRIVVDFRRLNDITVKEPFYMPTIEEIVNKLGDAKFFSKLDLTKGFHQIPIHPDSMDKTSFVTPFGKFRYKRLPFGLTNAPAVFQTTMYNCLQHLSHCVTPYIDDLIIFSCTWCDHLSHISSVLDTLKTHHLTAKPSKCVWGARSLEFLGKVISSDGITIPQARILSFVSYVKPKTIKQMRSFLGLVNFYRDFIPSLACYTKSLSSCITKTSPNNVTWSEQMSADFSHIISAISNHSSLTIPNISDNYVLMCDASSKGVGGVLCVCRDGRDLPVAYYSRQTRAREEKYSASELECLALVESLHHFKGYLIGKHFKVVTDHKALKALMTSTSLNSRLWRWLLTILDFSFDVQYRPGKDHVIPDALSRQGWDETPGLPCRDAADGYSSITFPNSILLNGGKCGGDQPSQTVTTHI